MTARTSAPWPLILTMAGACVAASAQVLAEVPASGEATLTAPAQGDVPPAEATPSPWSGMGVASATERRGSSRYNPDNAARMPRGVYELAAVLDYQREGLSARLRARTVARDIPHGSGTPPEHDSELSLTQLNWTHALGERWSLTLGKLNLGLDDGQSYHPLDFFEDTVRGSDFEDRAGRNRGFPMVMLQRTTPEGGLRLIYADDSATDTDYVYGDPNPNFNRGLRQAVLSWRRSQGAWTWTTVLQRAWPGHTGAGGSFSWVPGSAWSFYGAGFAAPGNPVPVHRNVAQGRGTGLNGQDVYINTSPMQPWQADDGRWRWRGLLGTQYTWEDGDSLQAELWRDGRGMGRDELHTWQQVLAFHDGLAHPVARRVNLGYDLEALRTPNGPHLFTRYSLALDAGATLQGAVLLAQDGSGSASARWTGPRWALGDLAVEAWQRFGSARTCYGAVPDQRGVGLLWRSVY